MPIPIYAELKKSLSENFYVSGQITKQDTKLINDTLRLNSIITKNTSIFIIDTFRLSDNYSKIWNSIKNYNETLKLNDIILKNISITKSDTFRLSDNYSKIWNSYKTYFDIIKLIDNYGKVRNLARTYQDILKLSDLINKSPSRMLSNNLTLIDESSYNPNKFILENLKLSANFSKKWILSRKTFLETLKLNDTRKRDISKKLINSLLLNHLKNVTPASSTCAATYSKNINLNWGNGTLTGTGFGSPTVSGGKLNLTGGKYVQYVGTNNADSLQVGCVKFKFTPNYSGAPGVNRYIFSISQSSSSTNNNLYLYHRSDGGIQLGIFNSAGIQIIFVNMGAWSQVSGTEYEFELDWDITTGATRLFINGTQFGITRTQTGIRSGAVGIFNIGAPYNGVNLADAYYDDVIVFSTVQHTANYTAGYTIPESKYLSSPLKDISKLNKNTLLLNAIIKKNYSLIRLISERINLGSILKKSTEKKLKNSLLLLASYNKIIGLHSIFSDILTIDDATQYTPKRYFKESLKLSDNYNKIWAIFKTYKNTLTLLDGNSYNLSRIILENIKLIDRKILTLARIYQDTFKLSDLINKSSLKIISDILTLSDGGSYNPEKRLQDNLLLEDNYNRIWNSIKTYQNYMRLIDKCNFGQYLSLIDVLTLSDGDIKDVIIKLLQEIIKLNEHVQISISQDLMLFADNILPIMLEASSL